MTRAEWLSDLRSAFEDIDGVARDLMRPARERELGPVLHAQLYEDAAGKIADLLAAPPDGVPVH